jgi:hypothetical protein
MSDTFLSIFIKKPMPTILERHSPFCFEKNAAGAKQGWKEASDKDKDRTQMTLKEKKIIETYRHINVRA